jgi:hypothetical protein
MYTLGPGMEKRELTTDASLDKRVLSGSIANGIYTGRRRRTFVHAIYSGIGPSIHIYNKSGKEGLFYPDSGVKLSYEALYSWINVIDEFHFVKKLIFSKLPMLTDIIHVASNRDPELSTILQDLADEIQTDISEACEAFHNPKVHYPPPEEGSIEPVTDDHVRAVITGLQRELDRELRDNGIPGGKRLPAAPLKDLPWRIQRALVERRRYRFLEWGITKTDWESKTFSLFNVRDDPLWIPRVICDQSGSYPSYEAEGMPDEIEFASENIYVGKDSNGHDVFNTVSNGRVRAIHRVDPYAYYD